MNFDNYTELFSESGVIIILLLNNKPVFNGKEVISLACTGLWINSGLMVINIFMLNSAEHEISTAQKLFSAYKLQIDLPCFHALRCCIYHANKC